jgi:hypothetical protein
MSFLIKKDHSSKHLIINQGGNMKHSLRFFTISLFIVVTFNINLLAQDNNGHVFTVTTFQINNPEDGSIAEFDSLNQLYTDKVIKKNEKIISQVNLRHFWGSDSRQFVIITEYKNMDDMLAANEVNNKLLIEGWPDKEERNKYNKAGSKYFGYHSDEIYTEVYSGRK